MKNFDLIKHIIDKDEDTVVVWLFNIGTEKYWGDATSSVRDQNENILVNHMEEMNLLITRKQDYMILRKLPEKIFLDSLIEQKFEIPNILCPQKEDESKSISELVLQDEQLLERIREISKSGNIYFVPYGVSYMEEKIADLCGLPLVGASHSINKMVNNKIFSRGIAEELSYKCTDGYVCSNYEEIENAYQELNKSYEKIIIKQPTGASGRGLWVIDNESTGKIVFLIIKRILSKQPDSKFLVEGWLKKVNDLNYQIYVSANGDVNVFSIKEQLVDGTVYIGSYMPPRIAEQKLDMFVQYGQEIGKRLYAQGFRGVLGIDSIIDENDNIIPIIEINARFTLSTYISFIQQKYPGKMIFSFYSKLKDNKQMNYALLKASMMENGVWIKQGQGAFCYVSETVNGQIANGNLRVFCMIVGDDEESINRVYNKVLEIVK